MIIYNPYDWYWDNGTGVFSSASQTVVPYTNPAYVAWLGLGNTPTRHHGDANLRDVLEPYGLGVTPAETTALRVGRYLHKHPSKAFMLISALTIRASSGFSGLPVALRLRVQNYINDASAAIIAEI